MNQKECPCGQVEVIRCTCKDAWRFHNQSEDFITGTVGSLFEYDELILEEDKVNNPSHYNSGGIECIEYLKDNLPHEAFVGYLEGNVKKYMHRWRYKNGVEDLRKAGWYLSYLVDTIDLEDN
jgi:hypothetical protein